MKKWQKRIYFPFIGFEIILYLTFLILDWQDIYPANDIIKYVSLLLVIPISIGFCYQKKERYSYLIGLFFVAGADYYLLFTETIEIGMFLFLIAHLYFYFWQARKEDLYLLTIVPPLYFIGKLVGLDLMTCLGMAYAGALLLNFSYSLIRSIRRKSTAFLPGAFFLLILCDLFVVLNFYVGSLAVWMWFFYLPSFLLLNYCVLNDDVHSVRHIN